MPDPTPKPASQRRRRNSAAAVRLPVDGPGVKAPKLPACKPALLASTKAWWATVWASPMAAVYLDADVPALVRLARLIDMDSRGLADGVTRSEIRQLEDRFGLSPLSRRRLQWEIDQATAPRPSSNVSRTKTSVGYGNLRVVLDDAAG